MLFQKFYHNYVNNKKAQIRVCPTWSENPKDRFPDNAEMLLAGECVLQWVCHSRGSRLQEVCDWII